MDQSIARDIRFLQHIISDILREIDALQAPLGAHFNRQSRKQSLCAAFQRSLPKRRHLEWLLGHYRHALKRAQEQWAQAQTHTMPELAA